MNKFKLKVTTRKNYCDYCCYTLDITLCCNCKYFEKGWAKRLLQDRCECEFKTSESNIENCLTCKYGVGDGKANGIFDRD